MMSERRVVLERSVGTLNDRFRKIQEDSTKEKQSEIKTRKVIRATSAPNARTVSMTRVSSRGVTKPSPRGRGGAYRGLSNSENNGRSRGRGRAGRLDSKPNGNILSKEGVKPKSFTGSRGRGRGRGVRGGRGRGTSDRSGGRGGEKKSVNKDDLDNEIESYMLKDADIGKDFLDSELSEYMLQRSTQTTTEEEQAADNQDE